MLDHSEVPSELATTATPAPKSPEKRTRGTTTEGTPYAESPPKKPKANEGRVIEKFNEDIKTLLEQPRKDAGYPRFTAMCDFCGITEKNLVTGLTNKDCRQFFLTGSCLLIPIIII